MGSSLDAQSAARAHGAVPFVVEGPGLDAFDEALRTLSAAAQVELDPRVAHEELSRALRARVGATEPWTETLRRAARPLGLVVASIEATPAQARVLRRDLDAPLLCWSAAGWVEALALDDAGDPSARVWVTAAPAAPFASVGAHDGAHDAHGHGGGAHPSIAKRLWGLFRLERDDIGVVAVHALAIGLLSLVTPIAVQALVNTVAFGALLQPVIVLAVIVFAILTFAAVLRALQVRVVEALQERLFVRVATDLAQRLPRVRAEAFDRVYAPELLNRFFDVVTVQKALAGLLLDGVAVLLQVFVGMLVLAFYHPALLAFDVTLVAIAVFVIVVLGARGPQTSIKESKAKYAVAAWLQEIARKPRAFATTAGAEFAAARADALVRAYLGARRKHFSVLFLQVSGLLGAQVLASAALLGLGGWLVIERQLTLGQLVAAELIVASVVTGLSKLGKQLEALYDLMASIDKLGHLVDLPLEPTHGDAPAGGDPRGARVRVFAPVSDETRAGASGARHDPGALTEVLSLEPGARLALVDDDELGRHALASAVGAARVDRSLVVEIEGFDTRTTSLEAHRSRVALLTVRSDVFEGSLFENVTVGRSELGHADVRDALERVGLGPAVRALPDGVETPLAVDGAPLTAGQCHLLSLARAVASKPRLIVIDGALDALAPEQQARALETLTAPDAPWTVLLLAPRGSAVLARWTHAVKTKRST